MRMRILVLISALLIAGSIVGCSSGNPPSASDLIVEGENIFDYGIFLSLSPDGTYIIDIQLAQICVEKFDSEEEQECWENDVLNLVNWSYMTWSPDGKQIAFTEDSPIKTYESDIWVFQIETGEFLNLTDDGQGSSMNFEGPHDLAPTWSPDSRNLVFSRNSYSDDPETALFHIPAGGGEPIKLLHVVDRPMMVWSNMFWSKNDDIFYTVQGNIIDMPQNGIWMVSEDGKRLTQLISSVDSEYGIPTLVSATGNGEKLLIWYSFADMNDPGNFDPNHWVIFDTKTGVSEPLLQAKDTGDPIFGIIQATFSPDGSKVLYLYASEKGCWLEARDVGGGSVKTLSFISQLQYGGCGGGSYRTLQWTSDDKVLATFGPGKHIFAQLGIAE